MRVLTYAPGNTGCHIHCTYQQSWVVDGEACWKCEIVDRLVQARRDRGSHLSSYDKQNTISCLFHQLETSGIHGNASWRVSYLIWGMCTANKTWTQILRPLTCNWGYERVPKCSYKHGCNLTGKTHQKWSARHLRGISLTLPLTAKHILIDQS
jgi:hypothetical protein